LKRYVVINGGKILDKFKELDFNSDNILSKEDFMSVLRHVNTTDNYDEKAIEAVCP
jgi:hypothetical protein